MARSLRPLVLFLGISLWGSFAMARASSENKVLHFDFPEVQIGTAVNTQGPTGITLFYFPKGAQAAIDIRGGSVGTFFTPEKMHQGEARIDGVAFTGGGILGLEAVAGAVSGLFSEQKEVKFKAMPLISGAVIFDFGSRQNKVYPNKALGQKAFASLVPGEFKQGKQGAGVSASVGKLFGDGFKRSGQGGAFAKVGKTKIAVFTVVNAVGVILDEKGEIIYGLQKPMSKQAYHQRASTLLSQPKKFYRAPKAENTTLTLVVINEKLAPRHLQQLGRQVHHALSQVIYPYATILDGDVLYTVSTKTIESDLHSPGAEIDADLNAKFIYLGMVAGELAKQAVWSAVGYEPPR